MGGAGRPHTAVITWMSRYARRASTVNGEGKISVYGDRFRWSERVRAEVLGTDRFDELPELLDFGLLILVVDDDAGVG
jgi:hypothetical protein